MNSYRIRLVSTLTRAKANSHGIVGIFPGYLFGGKCGNGYFLAICNARDSASNQRTTSFGHKELHTGEGHARHLCCNLDER